MTTHDTQYLDLVKDVLRNGTLQEDRTGTGTLAVFGRQMRFSLRDGTIPLLTTKKMYTRAVVHEILWYLQGGDNIKYLNDNKVKIWDDWADKDGNLGPVYGHTWRKWKQYKENKTHTTVFGSPQYDVIEIDQIRTLVDTLQLNPMSRRLIVSAWNVSELENMKLPPCHYSFQCDARPLSVKERMYQASRTYQPDEILDQNTSSEELNAWFEQANIPKYELSLILNQRSCDVGLGVPFNIVQYSILLRMLAHVSNMTAGDMIWNGGNVHIYTNHVEQLTDQLTREPYESPTLRFDRNVTDINDFKFEDFIVDGYKSHPTITMKVAV